MSFLSGRASSSGLDVVIERRKKREGEGVGGKGCPARPQQRLAARRDSGGIRCFNPSNAAPLSRRGPVTVPEEGALGRTRPQRRPTHGAEAGLAGD